MSSLASPVRPAVVGAQRPPSTAVALLHGLCSTPDELFAVASALRAAGHTVQALHIPGYAFEPSLPRQRASRCDDWVHEVGRQVAALRAEHGRVVLVGLSAGATLALAATLSGDALVDGLVLMSTTLRLDGWGVPWYRWMLPLAWYTPLGRIWRYRERPPYGVKDERVRAWVERQMRERRRSAAGASVLEVGHLRENHRLARSVLRQLRLRPRVVAPVLALHARQDEVASLANLDLLASSLRCVSFRPVVLEHSYHMISIDHDRGRLIAETLAFVDGLAKGAVAPLTSTAPRHAERVHA